ncbi:8-oxoguanine deaminase [Gordonia jinhuaensis]|uniref:8-oxoguanine deaminase n=1 Tax=Gordonia jinhuaensis TaxID=1517702 RepID=A0A916T3T1_9ACTN|nr:8-oxoguanine deaminase [Gordonia jinhuaensis]GGB27520.1 8-oxoguanine deaminase [Gordonia jinhuaensis]
MNQQAATTGSCDLLITGAYIYVDAGWEISSGWIAITDGRVAGVGANSEPAPTATETIDAGGRLVTPGLVNTHHHMYQNLTRSFAPVVNADLFTWLTQLYPIWSQIDDESVYLSTWVAMAELLLGGCTLSSDHMYVHPHGELIDAQVRAAGDLGFRFYANRGSMTRSVEDGGLPPVEVVQSRDEILADSERLIARYHDPAPGAMTRMALAPCSPFSVTSETMRDSAALAEKHDVRLHTHLAEDGDELTYCQEVYGMTPVEYFDSVGWMQSRSWVAHFIYPSPDEEQRMAAAGVGVAHCPSSNMLIGGGSADVQRLRGLGAPVGIGCDGSASTDHGSLWLEARAALTLARFRCGPTSMTARDVLDMATRGGARCLGWEDETGHLTPGACADLVIWGGSELSLAGALTDPVEAWLRCGPMAADTTVVAGRILVRDGQIQNSALAEMLTAHRRESARLQGVTA